MKTFRTFFSLFLVLGFLFVAPSVFGNNPPPVSDELEGAPVTGPGSTVVGEDTSSNSSQTTGTTQVTGTQSGSGTDFSGGLVTCDGTKTKCTFESLIKLIQRIIDFILIISPIFAAAGFVYAGILVFTSAGDSGQVTKAKEIFWNTAIGFIIILAAWFVVKALILGLGGTSEGLGRFLNIF